VGIVEFADIVIDVTGMINSSGELTLAGVTPAVAEYDFGAELNEMTLRFDPKRGLAGTLDFVVHFSRPQPGSTWKTGSFSSTTYLPLPDSLSWSGTWSGGYHVRSCSPDYGLACDDRRDSVRLFELRLQQSGAAVSGTLKIEAQTIPVSGTVTADSITLEGVLRDVPTMPAGQSLQTYAWKVQRRDVDRLVGLFSFSTTSPQGVTNSWEAATVRVVLLL
jgi:hypothetical protein